jgi:AcrR family transcriptional regulator
LITEVLAPTRERILDAAVELFGRQGYAGTSVGEIESAAGLSPRSGALYKHFPSKRALLMAAVQRRGRAAAELVEVVDAEMLGDVRAELHVLARLALREIGDDQPVLRIVMKEGDNFPELREEFHRRVVRRGHDQTASWLRLVARRAGVSDSELDVEALAAVLLGSIINYRVLETLFGQSDVDEARFLASWEASALKLLEAHGLVPEKEAQT